MKRLMYAPKVYIFIRSSNLGGQIYDVSSDVVNGSVTQNCGDLSKARFELRNRYQKWLRHEEDEGGSKRSIFLPMDMVTIWLQRVAGRPVQVFTGYLDSVPYYQSFPGNALFEASCTLKKLAYTWFDPGLQFFTQWVSSTDGWVYNPATGEATNPNYLAEGSVVNLGSDSVALMHDGGFAELLGRFMVEVAGWDVNDVLISELPPDLPKSAAKLYTDIYTDTEKDLKNLAAFLAQAMGVKGWDGLDGTQAADGTQVQSLTATKFFNTVQKQARKHDVPVLVLALAAYVLTAFNEKYKHDESEGSLWGYGVYALRPPKSAIGRPTPGAIGSPGISLRDDDILIDGKTPNELLNAAVATDLFCTRLNRHPGAWVQGSKQNDLKSMTVWIEKALGRPLPTADLTTALEKAKQYAHTSVVVTPGQTPTSLVDPASISFDSPELLRLLTDSEKQVIRDYYRNHSKPWLAAILFRAKQISRNLKITYQVNKKEHAILITGPASDMRVLYKSLQSDESIDLLYFDVDVWQRGHKSSLPVERTTTDAVYVEQSKQPARSVETSATVPNAEVQDAQGGAISFGQLAAFSANAAFAAQFAFPSSPIESLMLTGSRALMNDVSCLDGVKQFAQASLRTFRSLPDGRFLAFYPDYFGAYRKPYWKINDIEIIDFGIQLNDEALATHVYVIGDHTFNNAIDPQDRISSRGVATITQAFMLDSFIKPYKETPKNDGSKVLSRIKSAYEFLQHYGARPQKEEQPLIRNTFYEFLMAWQRFMQLWASQFATQAAFTFQPEVMAGGLIEFPDHEVQMYCESVTHNFDYAAGFSTTAVLTSPSLTTGKDTNPDHHMPGFALAGGVNTVGVG